MKTYFSIQVWIISINLSKCQLILLSKKINHSIMLIGECSRTYEGRWNSCYQINSYVSIDKHNGRSHCVSSLGCNITKVYCIMHGWLLVIWLQPRRITDPIIRRAASWINNGCVDKNIMIIAMENFAYLMHIRYAAATFRQIIHSQKTHRNFAENSTSD